MNSTSGVTTVSAAAAGFAGGGIALDAATRNGQNVGLEGWRDIEDEGNGRVADPSEPPHITGGSDGLQVPPMLGRPNSFTARDSYGSDVPLGAAGAGTGQVTPGRGSPYAASSHPSQQSLGSPFPPSYQSGGGPYYPGYGPRMEPEAINLDEIADDEDDEFFDPPQRRSDPSLGGNSSNDTNSRQTHTAAGAAASGGMLGSIGGIFKGGNGGSGAGPSYGAVPGSAEKKKLLGVRHGRRRAMIRALLLGFVILGGIISGIVAGIVIHFRNNGSSSSSSSGSGGGGSGSNDGSNSDQGDFDKNSPEIQALMNNQNLHKVFPAMDYTPWGVQYPLCLQYPPIQNNVTQDLAVLSQLTNTVRLYGTDCNQTEMVLYGISQLGLTDMKVWLGVWIDDTNMTTNERQLSQFYNIIDSTKDKSIFKGAIIGNEVLFRAQPDTAPAQEMLINYIQSVRANFTQRNLNLPIATSDLGSSWNTQLTQAVDVVMSNVHPFFGGVPIDQAAAWTWSFWQTNDVALTQGTTKQQVISEVGWPSGGGNDCSPASTCPNAQAGAVSGIDEMNKFMSDWVCQSLSNGTEYFW